MARLFGRPNPKSGVEVGIDGLFGPRSDPQNPASSHYSGLPNVTPPIDVLETGNPYANHDAQADPRTSLEPSPFAEQLIRRPDEPEAERDTTLSPRAKKAIAVGGVVAAAAIAIPLIMIAIEGSGNNTDAAPYPLATASSPDAYPSPTLTPSVSASPTESVAPTHTMSASSIPSPTHSITVIAKPPATHSAKPRPTSTPKPKPTTESCSWPAQNGESVVGQIASCFRVGDAALSAAQVGYHASDSETGFPIYPDLYVDDICGYNGYVKASIGSGSGAAIGFIPARALGNPAVAACK